MDTTTVATIDCNDLSSDDYCLKIFYYNRFLKRQSRTNAKGNVIDYDGMHDDVKMVHDLLHQLLLHYHCNHADLKLKKASVVVSMNSDWDCSTMNTEMSSDSYTDSGDYCFMMRKYN